MDRTNPEYYKSKENYDNLKKELESKIISVKDIMREVYPYRKQPFFNMEDFFSVLYRELKDDKFADWAVEPLNYIGNFKNQILQYCAARLAEEDKNSLIWFGVDKYLFFEKLPGLPTDVLRKLQSIFVWQLLQDFNYLIKDEINVETEDARQEYENSKKWFAQNMAKLLESSSKFTPQFLERLLKHFGADMYANTIGESRGLHGIKIMHKTIYTKFDVAYLLTHSIRSMDHGHFEAFMKKCDNGAKEYLRGFLFEDTKQMGHADALFMLSEDMSPMDINYQHIPFPASIRIITIKELQNENLRNKWTEVFNSFNIIPHQ